MLAVGLLILVPVVVWLSQAGLSLWAGVPVCLRIGEADLPRRLHRVNRVVTNLTLMLVLLGYPVLRGQAPLAYYGRLIPFGGREYEFVFGLAAAVVYLALLYLAWAVTDNVNISRRS